MKLISAFSNMLYQRTGLIPVVVALVIYVVFAISILSTAAQKLDSLSGHETEIPDLQFRGYSPAELYRMLDRMGAAGIQQYLHIEQVVDRIYPLFYTALLLLALSWGWRDRWHHTPNALWNLLPLAGMAFDYAENQVLLRVIHFLPKHYDPLARAASFFTLAKWVVFGISAFLILTSLWRMVLVRKK